MCNIIVNYIDESTIHINCACGNTITRDCGLLALGDKYIFQNHQQTVAKVDFNHVENCLKFPIYHVVGLLEIHDH